MNYPAQLEFYKHDDVYVTSCHIIFAIVQPFGTSAVGTVRGCGPDDQAKFLHQTANVIRELTG